METALRRARVRCPLPCRTHYRYGSPPPRNTSPPLVTSDPELPRVPSRSGKSTPRSNGCVRISSLPSPKRHLPRDLARVEVDGHQVREGRLGERDRAEFALRCLYRARSAGLPEHDACRAKGAVVAVLDVDPRIDARILADLVCVGFLRRPHVQDPGLGVERRSTPVCAAARARALERPLKAWRGEERTQPEPLHLRHCERMNLRCQIIRVF